jgi:hypothetical protein
MHGTSALAEKLAIAVFLRPQDRPASLGMAFDEFRCKKAEVPRQPQDFVRADADRLVAATPIAGVTGIRKCAVTPQVEIDAGNQIAVCHDVVS